MIPGTADKKTLKKRGIKNGNPTQPLLNPDLSKQFFNCSYYTAFIV